MAKRDRGRERLPGSWRLFAVGVAVVGAGTACGASGTARLVELGSGPASLRSFDGMPALACGGIGPLSLLTAKSGAEKADTPEAQGLRYTIAHDPTGGESPQSPHHWVLMAEHDGQVTFGQRTGPIGIGATVTLQRGATGYRFAGSGGCGPVGYADGQHTVDIDGYAADGRQLTVNYTGGGCDPAPPTVKVVETRSAVDLLAVSARPASGGPQASCADVGTFAHVVVQLRSPLGTRAVRDIGYLPARALEPGDAH